MYGCSTTGGTIGGLIPAPKFLKGKIENNIYYAQDSSFQIKPPFDQESYSYTYMEVKEQYANVGAYVSFNSSDRPNEIYRIEIGKKLDKSQPSPAFEKLVNGLLSNYIQQLKGYGTSPTELQRLETKLDGKRANLIILSQRIASKMTYHMIYIIQSSNGGGSVWVQWPHDCDSCKNGKEDEIMATNPIIESFIKSFKLHI